MSNFFNLNKEFFIIDSNKLDDVKTKFYGYAIQDTGIYEESNLDENAILGLDGCGCYVYVRVEDDSITIQQDFNGSYGIYLYQSEDYFVLSNSFYRLSEYLKEITVLTLNKDYCNQILCDSLVSLSYKDTAINEIILIDKDCDIIIKNNKITYKQRDFGENSVKLDSEDGIRILDKWFYRWTTLFRNLKSKTDNISVDLSGGFDSRMTFMLMAESGMNLNEIRINSINNELKTHKEDYRIASEIAKYYGVELNRNLKYNRSLFYSLEDIFNISFYSKMGIHKEMYFKPSCKENREFKVTGGGGEAIRAHWDVTASEFIDQNIKYSNKYPSSQREMKTSITNMIENGYEYVQKKYKIKDKDSIMFPLALYREARCRFHFGKSYVEDYFGGNIVLAPLIDPLIRSLKLSEPCCEDNNLLFALIYTRYSPYFLSVEYEGGRYIEQKTIEYAKSINEKYGRYSIECKLDNFTVNTCNEYVTEVISRGENNKWTELKDVYSYVEDTFNSKYIKNLFGLYFNDEIYYFAKNNAKTSNFHPLRHCYAVIAIAQVIREVEESKRNNSIIQNINNVVKTGIYNAEVDENELNNSEYINKLITARIDIRNESNDIEIEYIDKNVSVSTPKWFSNNGKGYVLQSKKGSLNTKFKCIGSGNLVIYLRAIDTKNQNDERLQIYINYKKFRINDKDIFTESCSFSHDNPYKYQCKVSDGDEIEIYIEWEPSQDMYLIKSKNRTYMDESINTEKEMCESLKIRLKNMEEDYLSLKEQNEKLRNSISYKIGYTLTNPVRMVRNMFKR